MQNKFTEKKNLAFKAGLVLIALAVLCWVFMLIIPFLAFSTKIKAALITFALIVGEVFFWIGAVLAGKDTVKKYINILSPRNWKKLMNDIETNIEKIELEKETQRDLTNSPQTENDSESVSSKDLKNQDEENPGQSQ